MCVIFFLSMYICLAGHHVNTYVEITCSDLNLGDKKYDSNSILDHAFYIAAESYDLRVKQIDRKDVHTKSSEKNSTFSGSLLFYSKGEGKGIHAKRFFAVSWFPNDQNGRMYIAFPGTQFFTDSKGHFNKYMSTEDLLADMKSSVSTAVHSVDIGKGFVDRYDYAKESINRMTADAKKFLNENEENVAYIVGHSLGGAIATVFAYDLIKTDVEMSRLKTITFGAPRVFSESSFSSIPADFKRNYFRIMRRRDPIPHLPPRGKVWNSAFTRYMHIGKVVVCRDINLVDDMVSDKIPVGAYNGHAIWDYKPEKMLKHCNSLKMCIGNQNPLGSNQANANETNHSSARYLRRSRRGL